MRFIGAVSFYTLRDQHEEQLDTDCVTTKVNGKKSMCPFYKRWQSMLERTTPKFKAMHTSYKDCKVCTEWLTFSRFKIWMGTQDWQGKELDKDLRGDGKLYSPSTCVFVPSRVNLFTTDCRASRGKWPIGVYWNQSTKKFRAAVSDNGKRKHLGYFSCPNEAHQAWKIAKQNLAIELIEGQSDIRVAQGLWRYALSLNAA